MRDNMFRRTKSSVNETSATAMACSGSPCLQCGEQALQLLEDLLRMENATAASRQYSTTSVAL